MDQHVYGTYILIQYRIQYWDRKYAKETYFWNEVLHNYREKNVAFRVPGKSEFKFVGEAREDRKKVHADCRMAKIQDNHVQVVEECMDIFGKVSGLPSKREI